jgi:hypothetical protein
MKTRTLIRMPGSHRSSVKTRLRRAALCSLPFLLLGSPLFLATSNGSDIPEWPHEQEERLSVVESELVDLQRKLLIARATNDEANQQQLEKRKKELERAQVNLLRATGQFPPR